MSKVEMKLGHSPDADDAFMFYGIASGQVSSDSIDFVHVIEEIQTLNKRALNKELEVTAISANGYLQVQDYYRILGCGASMGYGYGPIVVSKNKIDDLSGKKVAIPGKLTTAYLLLSIYSDNFIPVEFPFDDIMLAVSSGEVDAGLVIHEGQLTYKEYGFEILFDLGELWSKETSLPLPLGLNVVRRDIDEELQNEIYRVHKESIEYGLNNKAEALQYALRYGRGMDEKVGEKFVLMYVNEITRDLGKTGLSALQHLFARAYEKNLIDKQPKLDVLS